MSVKDEKEQLKQAFTKRIKTLMGSERYNTWGKRLGLSRSIIQTLRDGNIPDPFNLVVLSKAVKKPVGWLINGEDAYNVPEDLRIMPEDLLIVPLSEGSLAGGPGDVPPDSIIGEVVVQKKELRGAGGYDHRFVAIKVRGNSMEPILENGEIVIVDRTDTDPNKVKERSVYAVESDGAIYAKHLHLDKAGQILQLISANAQYVRANGFESVTLRDGEISPIIGRVVFSFRKWK